MTQFADWLHQQAQQRRDAGTHRHLQPRSANQDVLDLASNDYLGLARHPQVVAAAADAAATWGAGATGSRLVTGSTELHADLETDLAQFTDYEASVTFSSGYLANLGTVSALAGPDCLVVSDQWNHASLIDACRLSRSPVAVVPHADPAAVAAALADRQQPRALLVTDAVFSVDGDLAPLTDLHRTARSNGAVLVVDEAHSLGVVGDGGCGATAAAGLAGEPDVVATATLSKALGSQGGAVLASTPVINQLVNAARPFIFDTALAPAAVAAARESLRQLRRDPGLPKRALTVAAELHELLIDLDWSAPAPDAAVVSAYTESPQAATTAAEACREHGVQVGCFRPPSVPDDRSRLRLTARADLNAADLHRTAAALVAARKAVASRSALDHPSPPSPSSPDTAERNPQ